MGNSFFDFFQLMLAVYLFYAAFNTKGGLYEFPGVDEEVAESMRPKLKAMFLSAGCVALLDGAVSFLRTQMFTVTTAENGVQTITQNFQIGGLDFISYRFLSGISSVLTLALIGFFVFLFIWIRRKTK